MRRLSRWNLAAKKARRFFATDPGMGVIRHVDAGYKDALDEADTSGVNISMQQDK